MILHIYNPETDYALSVGRAPYTLPKAILALKKRMQLFPASFAAHGDAILLMDDLSDIQISSLDYFEIASLKNIRIVSPSDLQSFIDNLSNERLIIRPWGWNHSLRRQLLDWGIPEYLVKSEKEIDLIRILSHRSTAIRFQEMFNDMLPDLAMECAHQFFNVDDCRSYLQEKGDAFFKMPWSSSGRGVIHASSLSQLRLWEWINGCINRQKSVIAEPVYDKTGDFATEWICHDGETQFFGFSHFSTTPDGRYISNHHLSQEKIEDKLHCLAPSWSRDIINVQSEIIKNLIAPFYSGVLGIDMLTVADGALIPCLEINMRQTMGFATLMSSTPIH